MRMQLIAFFTVLLIGTQIGAVNLQRIERGEDPLLSRQLYCEYVSALEARRPRSDFSEDGLEHLFDRLWLSGKALDGYRSKKVEYIYFPRELGEFLDLKQQALEEQYRRKKNEILLLQESRRNLARAPLSIMKEFKLKEEIPALISELQIEANAVERQIQTMKRRVFTEAQYLNLLIDARNEGYSILTEENLILVVKWSSWRGIEVFPGWKSRVSSNVNLASKQPIMHFPASFLPNNLIFTLSQRQIPHRLALYHHLLKVSAPGFIPRLETGPDSFKLTFISSNEFILEGSSTLNRWLFESDQFQDLSLTSTNHLSLSALLDLSCLEASPTSEFKVISYLDHQPENALVAEKLLEELRGSKKESIHLPKLSFLKF